MRFANDDEAAWDRHSFLEYMLAGVVWRLEALAKRKGVDMTHFELRDLLGSPKFLEVGFADPYFAFLGGTVRTVTEAEVKAMPPAKRKAFKEAVRTGRAKEL